jgi:hypothetical protein
MSKNLAIMNLLGIWIIFPLIFGYKLIIIIYIYIYIYYVGTKFSNKLKKGSI